MPKRNKAGFTEQQVAFISLLPETGFNATEAALMAGYSPKSAHVSACRTLQKPGAQELMEELANERRERLQVNVDSILKDVQELIEVSMGRKEVPGLTGVVRFDAQAAKAALELLGKAVAMWSDRVEHVVSDSEIINDVQAEMSKRLASETVVEILEAVEKRILSRK